jgi:hypothetical protein
MLKPEVSFFYVPDEVTEFFSWPNPSSRFDMKSTQRLAEMSTINFPVGQWAAGA